jgi:FkbM family methyltransferase
MKSKIKYYLLNFLSQFQMKKNTSVGGDGVVLNTFNNNEMANMQAPFSLLAGPSAVPAIYLKNIYGQRILLDPRDLYLTLHYLEYRDWEDHLHCVFSEQGSRTLYIDVGANVGLHVLRAHMLGITKIIAFEPDPLTFELLRQNISINGGYDIQLHQSAVGSKTGSIGFLVDTISTGMSKVDAGSEFSVKLIKLDDLLIDANSYDSLFLKIDVEGLEGDVIAGAINLINAFENVTLIIEFGSQSSIEGVSRLFLNSEWLCEIYPWRKTPYVVTEDELRQWKMTGVVDLIMRKKN